MPVNSGTPAKEPLQPAAERISALLQRVHGLIERNGAGTFQVTERGAALATLLTHCPQGQEEELVKEFLSL